MINDNGYDREGMQVKYSTSYSEILYFLSAITSMKFINFIEYFREREMQAGNEIDGKRRFRLATYISCISLSARFSSRSPRTFTHRSKHGTGPLWR